MTELERRRGVLELFQEAQGMLRDRARHQWARIAESKRGRLAARARERTEVARLYRVKWHFDKAPLPFKCPACPEVFGSAHGRNCHAFACHGVKL